MATRPKPGAPSAIPHLVEAITLGDQPVLLVHEDLPLSKVKLDLENQRVKFLISTLDHRPDEGELEAMFWGIPEVKELYRAVKLNGGLIERIIVKADGTVVEGNCRTVVYRRLQKGEPNDERWQRIPSRILPEDINPKQLAILLGEMHVAGKNKWDAFEKAAYVYKMNEELGYSHKFLAEHLRMSKSSIKQLIDAYKLMAEVFLKKYPKKENVYKFSYFLEFYKKFSRRNSKPDPDLERKFIDWVGEQKLYEGNQVRDLPEIVGNPRALQTLETAGYKEAMAALEDERPELTSRLFAVIDRTTEALLQAPAEEIQQVKSGNPAKGRKLRGLYKALTDFADMADFKLQE